MLGWNGTIWAPTTPSQLLGSVQYDPTTAVAATTTSTTGADIDATNLSLTVTVPASGKICVLFSCVVATGGYSAMFLGLRESTTNVAYAKAQQSAPGTLRTALGMLVTGLSAGSHTYKAAFKSVSGTVGVSYGTQASPATTDPGPFTMTIFGVA